MSLDVGHLLENGEHECRLQFHDDGYYWFLHAWFVQVKKTTGKYVDLYGDAQFHESNGLAMLRAAMSEALETARRQPREWQVHTGTQLRPVRQELYATVKRSNLVNMISKFLALIEETQASGKTLAFLGD